KATPTRTKAAPTAVVTTEVPLTVETAGSPPQAAVATGSARAAPVVGSTSTPWAGWALASGGALVLLGALALGFLVVSSRRAAAEDNDAGLVPVGLDGLLAVRAPVPPSDTPTVEHP